MKKDSIGQVVMMTLLVCLVCSVVVSLAAVALRDLQQTNKQLNRNANILIAAGVIPEDAYDKADVRRRFADVSVRLVDLRTGKFTEEIDATEYDQRDAQRDPDFSRVLGRQEDLASIKRLEHYVLIYQMRSTEGEEIMVLPIRGYGLWSTLYGYMALGGEDYNRIFGLTFSDHAETPGLGGEVDNPKWKAQWKNKRLFDENGELKIKLGQVIGQVASSDQDRPQDENLPADGNFFSIDALSGASITTRGINNMLRFWFGELGYLKFIDNLKSNQA